MKERVILVNRINYYCKLRGLSYYQLSYKSTVPLTTILHILDCSTKNPGIFTLAKLCNGFGISLKEFFDAEEFKDFEYYLE